MNIREFLIIKYKEAKKDFNTIYPPDDYTFKELKIKNYINTITDIGLLIQSFQSSKMIESVDRGNRLFRFDQVLEDLLHNCMIENLKPVTEFPENGYGFKHFDYMQEQLLLIQYLEGYSNVQLISREPIYFVELGLKLQLLDLKK